VQCGRIADPASVDRCLAAQPGRQCLRRHRDRHDRETVNGDQNFAAALIDGGEMSMESVNGSVDIEFTEAVSARFDIETFNGSIRNCFDQKPERTSKYSPGLELRFEVGDGDSNIEIETLNGSVNICVDD
jgi:DUF4097 and DUF4098 domain-containing protein YvlB